MTKAIISLLLLIRVTPSFAQNAEDLRGFSVLSKSPSFQGTLNGQEHL